MAITYYDVGNGKPHATIMAAVNAIPGNLLGLGEQRVRVYAGGVLVGSMYRYDESVNTDAGFSNESDGVDFVSIYGMVPHNGLRNAGIVINAIAGVPVKAVTLGSYSKIWGIGITSSVVDKALYGVYSLDPGIAIENCLIYNLNAGAGGFKVYGIYINDAGARQLQNCAVANLTSATGPVTGIYVRAGISRVYNCSVLNMSGGTTTRGIAVQDTNATIINCAVASSGVCFICLAGAAPMVMFSISSDNTADTWGGANNQVNKDPAVDIKFIDSGVGSENIHIQEGSCAVNAGADLSAQGFTDDVDGESRV